MRFAYYRKAAQNAGVPEMWLDDATQDIAIRCWRGGDDLVVIRRAAIDAARHYGPHERTSRLNERPAIISLEVLLEATEFIGHAAQLGRDTQVLMGRSFCEGMERLVDFQRAWQQLPAFQRAYLRRASYSVDPQRRTSEYLQVYRARQRLRQLMEAA